MPTFVGDAPILAIPTAPDPTEPTPTPPTPPSPDPPDDATITRQFSGSTISALQTFLDASPNGSVIGLGTGASITGGASAKLNITSRSGISIVGQGATISRTARGTDEIIQINGASTNIGLYDFTIDGANPSPGTWDVTYEHEHGIAIRASTNIEISGVTIQQVGGDGLYVSGVLGSIWSRNVRMHGCTVNGNGRMGVSLTDGARDVVVDFNVFNNIAYYTWDIEPNGLTIDGLAAGAINCRFSDNTISTKAYGTGTGGQAVGYLIASTGSSGGGPAKDIQVLRNTMSAGEMRVAIFNNGMTNSNWTIADNTGSGTFTGGDPTWLIQAYSVAGLTVTGNTQACNPDSLFETHSGSTSVTISGNTF